jgi:hypothetical protein
MLSGKRIGVRAGDFRCSSDAQWFPAGQRAAVGLRRWAGRFEGASADADSAEGHRHQGYAITMAMKPNPGAELVIDDDSED